MNCLMQINSNVLYYIFKTWFLRVIIATMKYFLLFHESIKIAVIAKHTKPVLAGDVLF